jgi:ABC-type branched-subunit amino acid transport system substrate-binding protein
MHLKKKMVVFVFVFALIAAACGGSTATTTTAAPGGGGDTTTTAPAPVTTTTKAGPTTTVAPPAPEIKTDIGVTDTEISIGLLADLTGPFSGLTVDIVDAQLAYWENVVNANGGIAGRMVVPVVEDTAYDVVQHGEKYTKIVDQVVAFSNSTGSPHTASILDDVKKDNVLVIPLSWYSGWADPNFDNGLTFEQGTNYCLEAMNVVQWLAEKHEAETGAKPTLAIVTRAGDYGQDAAAGAKYAAAQLGLEIVYDGEGTIVRGQDRTPIISAILAANPDWVWITSAPSETGEIMGGAVSQGFTGQWTGSVPSYDFRMLDSALAPALQGFYWQTGYNVTWGTDVPGMKEISEVLTAAYPDRRPSDAFIFGWIEAKSMEQILRTAAANGDLTRQGVIDAANSIDTIALNGTGPDFNYKGEPNDYVNRSIYILKPSAENYAAAGGADQKLSDGLGTTGSTLVEGPFTRSIAADFNFTGACWTEADGNTIGTG